MSANVCGALIFAHLSFAKGNKNVETGELVRNSQSSTLCRPQYPSCRVEFGVNESILCSAIEQIGQGAKPVEFMRALNLEKVTINSIAMKDGFRKMLSPPLTIYSRDLAQLMKFSGEATMESRVKLLAFYCCWNSNSVVLNAMLWIRRVVTGYNRDVECVGKGR